MYGDKHEDDFNYWIHEEAKKRGLEIKRHPEEECWIVMYAHRDDTVPVTDIKKVEELLAYANSEGYKCRSWLEEIKTSRHHNHLANIICFCYNG